MRVMLAVLFAILLRPAFAQVPERPANLDFEQGKAGAAPEGWVVPTRGFRAKLTGDNVKQGKLCAVLERDGKEGAPQVGNLMQTFNAGPYRGRRVRYRASVRFDPTPTGARAQLWLRVDRKGGQPGFFENMNNQPIFGGLGEGWQTYEITGDIDADAEQINIGALLLGGAKMYIDAVSVTPLGIYRLRTPEAARPLSGRGLDNLTAFTRLLGYVRHFHPSDQAAECDWEAFAVENVDSVEKAGDATELARTLRKLFTPVAPTVLVFPTGPPPKIPPMAPPESGKVELVSWRHIGYGGGHSGMNVYSSERMRAPYKPGLPPKGFTDPSKPLEADLGGGVSCVVPLTLFADSRGTLPHVAKSADSSFLSGFTGADRAARLTDVILAWNIFQHFYPYFDVVHTDWPAALREALTSAATDKDGAEFLVTLRRLVVALHDGHGHVDHPSYTPTTLLPLWWDWIEDRLVVTAVGAGAEALKPGDIVVSVDGKAAAEAIAAKEALVSGATPQWRRFSAIRNLLAGINTDPVDLEVKTGDNPPRKVTLVRKQGPFTQETRPDTIAEIQPGIYYVDLDRATDAGFNAALPKLAAANGVIFDLRGYPNQISPVFLQHLTDKPIQSAHFEKPVITRPDREGWTYTESRWDLPPLAPRLKGHIAFLVGGASISYAESVMAIVEYYKLADIIGAPTAGTNGNINPVTLPGGYRITWTGMRVTRHDGKPHHGHGIEPTVPVFRTIAGVTAGHDEVLERALEVVAK